MLSLDHRQDWTIVTLFGCKICHLDLNTLNMMKRCSLVSKVGKSVWNFNEVVVYISITVCRRLCGSGVIGCLLRD